ncbi:lantibiotic dehydratase [Plantactinospora siamensis]|uniref:Lantibiotic dehydratase n=1 Tax=Plantactinospora siamensis TaxID=555372 RepID=A0ABV6P4M1_9ACTN
MNNPSVPTQTGTATPMARLRDAPPAAPALAPGHFIPLPGGFELWSQGVLRSGGFPIAGLLDLGDHEYAAAADRWLAEPGDDTRRGLAAAAARATVRQAELLGRIARRPDFLEAVGWQNPDVVEPMIVRLGQLGADAPNNHRLRKRQRIVAKYWARYCAKNETIGFFGPVSWFDFRDGGEPLRMRPGPALIARGELHLETWAVDALAARLTADPQVRPWVAPRRHPIVHLAGARVRTLGGPVDLDEEEARVLALVDGHRLPAEIAAECGVEPSVLHKTLELLAARELLIWDLEPPLVQHAERELRGRLDRIGDATVRGRAIAALDRLESARDALADYRDPDQLRRLNERLEHEFTALTGVDPARRPGQSYGGRRLAYVDCARDVALSFGPQVLRAIAEPLSLLLTSARWYVHEAAERMRRTQLAAFDAMGVESTNYMQLVLGCADTFLTPGNRPQDQVAREFVAGWRAILGLDTDARVVTHRSDALRQRVAEVFAGGYPSWGSAHTHSIDLLLAARGAAELARGAFQPVLGEFHIAYCPFETPCFSWPHPDREELRAMLATVIPASRVILSPVKDYPRVTARTYPWLNDARDWRLCVSAYPPRGDERLLPLYGLEARRDGDRLMLGLPGAAERFEVMDVGGAWLTWDLVDAFKQVVGTRPHTPRVVVDDLVMFRETWSFPIDGLDWISARSDPEHFVAARRWLRAHGLPDIVFASISSEPKPIFVDFRSEVQVGNLAQLLRAAGATAGATVTISEMLPAPDQSWLADAAGNVYTCELRLLFADRAPGPTG